MKMKTRDNMRIPQHSTSAAGASLPHGYGVGSGQVAIAVVDVSAEDAAWQISNALSGPGFFYVAGHGISEDLMNGARAAARSFFALPQSSKESCVTPTGALPFGYRGLGKISLGPETQSQPDTRESFIFSTLVQAAWCVVDEEVASGRLPPDFKATLTE
jgi:isopenicillin N synthase-like dioxygenase